MAGFGDVALKYGVRHPFPLVFAISRTAAWRKTQYALFCGFALLSTLSFAQSTLEEASSVHGVVINSVTQEPISRALVTSSDNRFATLTNSEGRFEFSVSSADSNAESASDPNSPAGRMQVAITNRFYSLSARKPGYLAESSFSGANQADLDRDVVLKLTPEALIVGTVALPSSEAPDGVTLQLFRSQVQDGRAHWVPAGGTRSRSNGEFRFADLPAGTYKLLTHELLDRDPTTFDPHGALFGYPPVYYPSAPDFGSATTIQVSAGQTAQVEISLVRQQYYRVKVPVLNAAETEVGVLVYSQGHKGPGFTLGYNNVEHTIEGMLPNGTYTVEATSYGAGGATGVQTINIKGSPVDGPAIVLAPNTSIPVTVKEEFTGDDHGGSMTWNINGRNFMVRGPRRYLNVLLEPTEDFGSGTRVSLRSPTGPGDESLVLEGARAGTYWVRVNSSRGYPASLRSGNIDLLHQPLVVNPGGVATPIEITMRDDTAEISGTVEGMAQAAGNGSRMNSSGLQYISFAPRASAHVYCVPLADSPGQFAEVWVNPDGTFVSPGLAPGTYRLLAFYRGQPALEYRNPEAMAAYDTQGTVVRLSAGQKENVQLHVIQSSEE